MDEALCIKPVACDDYTLAEYLRPHEKASAPPCLRDMDPTSDVLGKLSSPPCQEIGYCLLYAIDSEE